MNFIQSRTMRDTAAMLDVLSEQQPGDPFNIYRPSKPYRNYLGERHLWRIGWTASPLSDAPVDPEIVSMVENVATVLDNAGHFVESMKIDFDHETASRLMTYYWFFGFSRMLDQFAYETGLTIGPDTLEAMVLGYYYLSKCMHKD